METQWPLVIFTFFVCVTCGLLGSMSVLALKGQGRDLQMTALVASAVSLVIGGIGSFLHLQHWERIFNGFGHITSGITQELIGCVVLAILIVVWFVMLRGSKNQDQDIDAALDALQKDSGYLFEPVETPPPYAAGTGTAAVRQTNNRDVAMRRAMGLPDKAADQK